MKATAEPVAWVLNLDAEDELALGRVHTPTAATIARARELLPKLTGLIRPGDAVLFPQTGERPSVLPPEARCWCPTRWALKQVTSAGLTPPPTPGDEVLRRVNHRRFSHELGEQLPGATFVTTRAELDAALADLDALARTSTTRQWLLKRPLGYAGRGRRKLKPGPLDAADQAWLDASLRDGDGLQLEPLVQRELDCALHGFLTRAGVVTWGQPTVQRVDETGAWVATEPAPAGALTAAELDALHAEGRKTAEALTAAGYFGPFGLDAFRWVDPSGGRHFRPRCEVNARYSMGWATGLRDVRPER